MEYQKKSHSVYLLTYHIVFVVKFRKPVINEEISAFIKRHGSYLCARFGGEMMTCETDKDHVHMLVSLPPDVAPATLVRTMKTQLSKEIHLDKKLDEQVKKFLFGDVSLWSPSYFVATTGTSVLEKVKEYIESQQTEEHKRKYEKTGRYSKKNRTKK